MLPAYHPPLNSNLMNKSRKWAKDISPPSILFLYLLLKPSSKTEMMNDFENAKKNGTWEVEESGEKTLDNPNTMDRNLKILRRRGLVFKLEKESNKGAGRPREPYGVNPEVLFSPYNFAAKYRYLFNLKQTEYVEDMPKGVIKPDLKKAFEEEGHDVQDDAKIRKEDKVWLIFKNGNREYMIEKDKNDEKLLIYEYIGEYRDDFEELYGCEMSQENIWWLYECSKTNKKKAPAIRNFACDLPNPLIHSLFVKIIPELYKKDSDCSVVETIDNLRNSEGGYSYQVVLKHYYEKWFSDFAKKAPCKDYEGEDYIQNLKSTFFDFLQLLREAEITDTQYSSFFNNPLFRNMYYPDVTGKYLFSLNREEHKAILDERSLPDLIREKLKKRGYKLKDDAKPSKENGLVFSILENIEEVVNTLDNENIPEPIRERHGNELEGSRPLPDEKVSVIEKGKLWEMKDEYHGYHYIVRKENEKLNVYEREKWWIPKNKEQRYLIKEDDEKINVYLKDRRKQKIPVDKDEFENVWNDPREVEGFGDYLITFSEFLDNELSKAKTMRSIINSKSQE